MASITITSANFEKEVLKSDKPVLVDFWAVWCGPCSILSPIVEQIADENESIKVGKVNVDDEMDLAQQFQVMNIPTLLFFKDGKAVDMMVGVHPKADIEKMIQG